MEEICISAKSLLFSSAGSYFVEPFFMVTHQGRGRSVNRSVVVVVANKGGGKAKTVHLLSFC